MSQPFRFYSPTWVALILAMLVACSDSELKSGSLGLGLNVQVAWQRARTASGHKLHVGQHRVRCAQCHELTSDVVGPATPTRCGSCHERESRIHHAAQQAEQRFGKGVSADCTTCHAFTVASQPALASVQEMEPARADCARCHASGQGQTPAVLVHGSSQCTTCHRPHQDASPEPGRCAECHREITTTHANLDRPPIRVCTTCHQHQHAPASDALSTCQKCHEKERPLVPKSALFAGGHSACVGCHRPHDFEKKAAQPCRSCHAEVRVLGASRVPAHDQCVSCHAPHDVRGNPAEACAKCHADVHPNHPVLDVKRGCVGCHDPHPPASHAREAARACSSCHQLAHSETEFHGGLSCTQCHKPHAFALAKSQPALCATCHEREVARVAARSGHTACEGCHRGLPHRPTTLLAGCGTCHAAQEHEARTGHQSCTACHEPHSGALATTKDVHAASKGAAAAPCQSCHAKEALTAPAGHADCVNCHQPHSGVASRAACASCHESEARSMHGSIAGGCSNCHRPHGPRGTPSPPTCTTCHKASLPGLHELGKHQNCTRCHSAHAEQPTPPREACLACHADRKTHFPGAPRCASCHLFGAKPR